MSNEESVIFFISYYFSKDNKLFAVFVQSAAWSTKYVATSVSSAGHFFQLFFDH